MYPEWFIYMVVSVVGSMMGFFAVKAYRTSRAERMKRRAEKKQRKA